MIRGGQRKSERRIGLCPVLLVSLPATLVECFCPVSTRWVDLRRQGVINYGTVAASLAQVDVSGFHRFYELIPKERNPKLYFSNFTIRQTILFQAASAVTQEDLRVRDAVHM